jgi:hypothetical protein
MQYKEKKMPRNSKRNSPGPRSQRESMKQKAHMEKLRRDSLIENLRDDIADRDAIISILRGRIRTLKHQLRTAQ